MARCAPPSGLPLKVTTPGFDPRIPAVGTACARNLGLFEAGCLHVYLELFLAKNS